MIIIFISLILSSFSYADSDPLLKYPSLSKDGYTQLQSLAKSVSEKCPEPDCMKVFIGRSNTLLSASLEAHGDVHHVDLPVSGLKSIALEKMEIAKERFNREVVQLILKPKLKNISKVAVIDYMTAGRSLSVASIWIKELIQDHPSKVIALGYGSSMSDQLKNDLILHHIELHELPFSLEKREGELSLLVSSSKVETYAPYDEWRPAETEKPSIDPSRRLPYYYHSANGPQYFASYEDVVKWFQRTDLEEVLFKPRCATYLHDFSN